MAVPLEARPIIENLVHSLKLITSKVLPNLPISGNVRFDDQWDPIDLIVNQVIRLPKAKEQEVDLEKEGGDLDFE